MGLFNFLKRKKQKTTSNSHAGRITNSSNVGNTIENAIIINAQTSSVGVAAEYSYISKKHGERNSDWHLVSQSLIKKKGKNFDALHIKLKNGQELIYYFDISMFFGRF